MRGPNLLTAVLKRLPRSARRGWLYAIVRVDDPQRRTTHYWFSRQTVTRGLSLGAARKCDIRLSGTNVRSVHARLDAMSNHWVLKYLPGNTTLPLPEHYEGEYDDRVDRVPFEIEAHTLLIDDD